MAPRRRRGPVRTHTWFQVERSMHCITGGHEVGAGTWVRMRLNDFRKWVTCEGCLLAQGVVRPLPKQRPFTFTREGAQDVRKRQVGDE